jgi:acetyltransferase-like isoleucine patch superfamily enzyme
MKLFFFGILDSGEGFMFYKYELSGNISIGKYTSLWAPNLDIYSGNQKVFIGNFCSIARNVSMQTYNHNMKKLTTYFIGQNLFKENWEDEKVSKGDINIKNDVWVGSHCVLLGGITIGNGAIVAANSVVTNDVPAFSIVAGSPAKVIGKRFDDITISKIEKLEWWYWPITKIKKNKSLFTSEFDSSFI